MVIVMTVGLLMCHLQFELLIEFLDWFAICGLEQYYDEVQADGAYSFQICYFSFSSDYVSHVRDDLHFLLKFCFMLPYARFGIFADRGH